MGKQETETEGRVRDVTHSGEAVIETSAGIVFARGGLPGERVRVAITGKQQGALRGRVLGIVQAHAERVTPSCPRVEACGGCPLMPLGMGAQLAWKRERVAHALGRAPEAVALIASPQALGYRTRARLAFRRVSAGVVIGYRAAGSHDVVDAPDCAVLAPALAAAYAKLRVHMRSLVGQGEIAIELPERAVAHIACAAIQPPEVYRELEALAAEPELQGVSLAVAGGAAVKHGELQPRVLGRDGEPLAAPAFGFAQANRALNDTLVETALQLAQADGARVLELYAGHGNFTLGLARVASELIAVESEPAAADACRRNLKARGLAKARVREGDAAKIAGERGNVDVVVLDPPRTGAKEALAGIVARKPKRIVYVSCDPITLRRDVHVLAAHGYAVDAAYALDMFPHTPHVESVVRLVRDDGKAKLKAAGDAVAGVLCALLALASGCASWLPAPIPMQAIEHRATSGAARCLVVFLPGRGDAAEDFATQGFVAAVQQRQLAIDVVAAQATLGYYAKGIVTERLHADVIAPRLARGYAEVWLVGLSMGGLGTLLYAREHPRDVKGLLALAPYLDDSDLHDAIREAGGLLRWKAPQRVAQMTRSNYEAEVFRFAQAVVQQREPGPALYVAYGRDDRLAEANALIANALPKERAYAGEGGHNWDTWRGLWKRFLNSGALDAGCARAAP